MDVSVVWLFLGGCLNGYPYVRGGWVDVRMYLLLGVDFRMHVWVCR